jgi:CheY-like chemotaxis protein
MSRILVVEDSRTQSTVLKGTLESHGFEVTVAENGVAALEAISRQAPHAVLTDLLMPVMNGLELVEQIRKRFPRVPTILVTEYGSEEVAAEALQRGAAGYIPKRRIANDLVPSLERVLGIAKANPRHQKLIDGLLTNELRFVLDNDLSVVPHLVSHLQDCVGLMRLCDETAQRDLSRQSGAEFRTPQQRRPQLVRLRVEHGPRAGLSRSQSACAGEPLARVRQVRHQR